MKVLNTVQEFLKEVKIELGRVSWPKRDQAVRLTLLVIAIGFLVGTYLGILDFLLAKGVSLVVARQVSDK